VYIALGDAGSAVAKFLKSGIWDKVPEGSILVFDDTLMFLKHSVGKSSVTYIANKQLDA